MKNRKSVSSKKKDTNRKPEFNITAQSSTSHYPNFGNRDQDYLDVEATVWRTTWIGV